MPSPDADDPSSASRTPGVTAVRIERWRLLGRLLPGEVRERVFDPAFYDLLYTWLTRPSDQGRPASFAARAIGTYVRCIPVSVPKLFFRRGRLTRLGAVAAWALPALLVVAFLVVRMSEMYRVYGETP